MDNWASAKLFILGQTIDFLEVKVNLCVYFSAPLPPLCHSAKTPYSQVAFNAGASYVNEVAGKLLSAGTEALGNIARNVRKLPGRVVGYLDVFIEKLGQISEKVSGYAANVETFLELVAGVQTVAKTLNTLLSEALVPFDDSISDLLSK